MAIIKEPPRKYRAEGSAQAREYGATNIDGSRVRPKKTPVVKAQRRPRKVSTLERDGAASLAHDRRRGVNPDPHGQLASFDALRRAFSPPGALRSVKKAKDKTPQVAVYDANGNLLGIVDPDDLMPLATGTPVQPGSPQDTTDMDDAAARSVQAQQQAQPVAKSRAKKAAPTALKPVKKAQTKPEPGVLIMRPIR